MNDANSMPVSGPRPRIDDLRRLSRRADHLAQRIATTALNETSLQYDRAELSALQRVLNYFGFDESSKGKP